MTMNPMDYKNHPGHADHEPDLDEEWKPKTEPIPCAGLSGGEVPPETAELRAEMIRKISAQDDVREVIEVSHRCDGTFLYLIETPFLNSFPRFVIGTCDRNLEKVNVLFRCGARWSADAKWYDLRHVEGGALHV